MEIKGYETSSISGIKDSFVQVVFENGVNEITFRTGKGNEDISGDYNAYENEISEKIGIFTVVMKGNGGVSNVFATDGETVYTVYSEEALDKGVAENILLGILK